MSKQTIITGLDIGSHTIKALSAIKRPGQNNFDLLAKAKTSSSGIRKGVVIDLEKVSKKITLVLEKIEKISGEKIEEVWVNINGSHLFIIPSHGTIAVSRADQKISQEDVERVIQAAQAFPLPLNKEIIEVFPTEFTVDEEKKIKDILGMQGTRIEVDILALCAFSPYLKNLINTVLRVDVQVADIISSPMASAKAVLSSQQKELGVAVIDVGAGTTGLSVFEEGELVHTAVFPIGSSNITNDIAIGLKCDINLAERVKTEFGSCLYRQKENKKKIKIPLKDTYFQDEDNSKEQPFLEFSLKILVDIIEARVSEIFDVINKELKKISKAKILPAGIVLTGGGSKIPQIVGLAKKELKLPVKIGYPQGMVGIEDDVAWAGVCGLVLHGIQENSLRDKNGLQGSRGIISFLKKIFKKFVP
ncbi:MAG: cell division protein FtsA [Candidatus Pacebacteria bacterium]|nr:cell division protein FtsA [Candidatus Paceibacterota bacterium]